MDIHQYFATLSSTLQPQLASDADVSVSSRVEAQQEELADAFSKTHPHLPSPPLVVLAMAEAPQLNPFSPAPVSVGPPPPGPVPGEGGTAWTEVNRPQQAAAASAERPRRERSGCGGARR